MTDEKYMLRAVELAKKGAGFVNPNPMVGAVIVKDDMILGEGYHQYFGGLHAERNAIKNAKERGEELKGATIYVTLEPCCHHGKTPPCTEAIIEEGISRVIIGSRDPNPRVSGGGVKALEEAGIEVIQDFLRSECDRINPVFFHYISTKTPYVILKYAMTMDGKIATKTGESKWITGEPARARVHKMRHDYMAIMTATGTVLADDPMLNARIENGKNPIRIICDSKLRIPMESNIVKSAREIDTIVVCAIGPNEEVPTEKKEALSNMGIRVINLHNKCTGKVDLPGLMELLGSEGIDSVIIEAGGIFAEAALSAGIVNEISLFMAPKIFGGRALSPVEGPGIEKPDQALGFVFDSTEVIGEDILIRFLKKQ